MDDNNFDQTVKALRELAGLSLSQLAKLATYSKSAIGHIETGERKPTPELAKALDKALAANGLLIALASLQRNDRRNVDAVKRRDMLKTVTAGTVVLGASVLAVEEEEFSHRLGQSDVEVLLRQTARLRALDNSLGGADTYCAYLAQVGRTDALLKKATYGESVRKALLALLAEQTQLAGWAAFDAGWTQQAQGHFDRSRSAAQQTNDVALEANALALRAYQCAFAGRPDIGMVQASCDLLRCHVSPPRTSFDP